MIVNNLIEFWESIENGLGKEEVIMEKTKLVVLQTSDIHGHIYPIHYGTNKYTHVGLGKLSTLVKEERSNNEHVLLVDNGDLIQGTPLTYHYTRQHQKLPHPMIIALNEMRYDAAVIGNHEFNYGKKLLHSAVSQSNFPWLSANILDASTGKPYFGKPYVIKSFSNKLRVGILGVTTPCIPLWEKPEHIRGLLFESAVKAAKKWVPILKEKERADVVIITYHGGFERNLNTNKLDEKVVGENEGFRLCQEVAGVDALLTGHQHMEIAGREINGVTIIQPGSFGSYLGKITFILEKLGNRWSVIDKQSELRSVKQVPADQTLLDQTMSYEKATQAWLDQPIGRIEGDMLVNDPLEIRLKDNALIEFVHRVQMAATGANISVAALFDHKPPGFPEHVTMREVVSNYIYPNTLTVIRITGKDMKAALEQSATYFKGYDGQKIEVNPAFIHPKPQHYNYDMWEGIDYLINISKPEGERIVKLEYEGVPVDLEAEYEVVMSNYRSSGGGQYDMFQGKPIVKEIPIDVSELIANYIIEKKVVQATVNNNWKIIHD